MIYSVSTIEEYAKEDNLNKYNEILFNKILKIIINNNINHNLILKIIHLLYYHKYKCIDLNNNKWFVFRENNHKWCFFDIDYEILCKELIDLQIKFFCDLRTFIIMRQNLEFDNVIEKIDECIKFLKNIDNYKILKNIIPRNFYDNEFEKSLNNNPYLIGFENGVFDLRLEEMTDEDSNKKKVYLGFRKGIPEDRISFSTGYDYNDKYSENNQYIKEINKFIKKIQPCDDMREYILRLFASYLDGKNRELQFRIFTGCGNNGKSKLIDLLLTALGDYGLDIKSTFLTTSINNNEEFNKFLSKTKGKRFIALQEPEENSSIQVSKMKLLTGGDKIITNGLCQNNFEFVPQFKMILLCNKLPNIPYNDSGTWRRIRVTHFTSKFVKNKDEINKKKHHYLADLSINEQKIKEWAPAFIWILLNIYYVKYINLIDECGGLQEPEEIRIYTEKYRKENDVLFEFIRENFVITESDKDNEKLVVIYNQFKEWHRENYNVSSIISRKELEEYFVDKLNLCFLNGIIYGIKGSWDCNSDNDI
jgi:P4 family phage/plasmid primase-like protien